MDFTPELRPATPGDVAALEQLIRHSVRVLQASDYTDAQREAALRSVFGVDTELIADGTYFVVEIAGKIVACGGWSRRKTLFGSDRFHGREAGLLDPLTEAAKIRAFFVRPGYERRGIGSALLSACEAAAKAEGFSRLELGSTLTGIALYRVHGFVPEECIDVPIGEGLTLPVVRMSKNL